MLWELYLNLVSNLVFDTFFRIRVCSFAYSCSHLPFIDFIFI